MAPRFDEAPEAIPDNYPEVHYPPAHPELSPYGSSSPASPSIKREDSTSHTHYAGSPTFPAPTAHSPYSYDNAAGYPGMTAADGPAKPRRQICGCPLLIFMLSAIIAFLSAVIIGLAAGTGVAASRANNAESQLASVSAALASATATPAAGDYSAIDRKCSTDSQDVTGSTYTSQFYAKPSYKIYCNSDTPYSPLQALFVANFDDCIDACASWSYYTPKDFRNTSTTRNSTCSAVSFVPQWTDRTLAVGTHAPGNCYLKPGPQNRTALVTPNIGGGAIHAAILEK